MLIFFYVLFEIASRCILFCLDRIRAKYLNLFLQMNYPIHVLPLKYSIWLVISSLSFLVPSWLALCRSLYWHCAVYFMTAAASANYWRKAQYGFRRNVDVVVARLSFVFTLVTGIFRVQGLKVLIVGWTLVIAIPIAYKLSLYLEEKRTPLWLIAHFAMHCFISAGMLIVVLGTF